MKMHRYVCSNNISFFCQQYYYSHDKHSNPIHNLSKLLCLDSMIHWLILSLSLVPTGSLRCCFRLSGGCLLEVLLLELVQFCSKGVHGLGHGVEVVPEQVKWGVSWFGLSNGLLQLLPPGLVLRDDGVLAQEEVLQDHLQRGRNGTDKPRVSCKYVHLHFTRFYSLQYNFCFLSCISRFWYQSSLWSLSQSLTSMSQGTSSLAALPTEIRSLWPTAPTSQWPPFSGLWSIKSETRPLASNR